MGTHRFQLDSINATEVGNLSEPGLVATSLAARPQIDVTLANDAFLPDLTEAMAQFGYSFVASAPTTPRATSNLLVDMSDPGATTTVAPAGTMRARYDNTQKALVMSVDGGAYFPLGVNPPNGASFFEDFLSSNGTVFGNTNWISVISGTGSAVTVGPGVAPAVIDGAHQGILLLNTGTTATGRAAARQAAAAAPCYSNVAAAGGNTRIEFLVSRVDALSDGVNNYATMFGWSDAATTGFGANCALLCHDPATSLTNWVVKTLGGGSPVTAATAIPISAAGAWDKLTIDISASLGVRYFVNGVLAATHALTAAPPSAATPWTPIAKIEKSLALLARRVAVDYSSWSFRLSAAR
jgi:hypothetical protein